MAMADLVKTTLGPCGLDKILQHVSSNDTSISVTNDGATILRQVHVDNAAAQVLVELAKVQDQQIGDGTTSVVVLAGEMLRQAEDLVVQQRIHPQTIAAGWRLALDVARAALDSASIVIQQDERDILLQIAKTTLSSKLLTHEQDHFAQLAVDAVLRVHKPGTKGNLQHIQVLTKPGASLAHSYLEEGFLLDTCAPMSASIARRMDANILLANTSMDTDKIKVYGARVRVSSLNDVAAIEAAERHKMSLKVDRIVATKCNVFINRQLIYNYPETLLAAKGIMAIEHADFDGIDRLAAVLGGDVVSVLDYPEQVTLGHCDVVEEVMIGEDKVLRFGGCKAGAACSLVLRGSSQHVLAEAERSMHDALSIVMATVNDPRVVYGGGCCEILMAAAVNRAAETTPGKKALAMAAFARALLQIPTIVADNGGLDAAELVTQLRAAHAAGKSTYGLDMEKGCIGDMCELGIRESYKSKLQSLMSAAEAAEMILRVDDIVRAAPRRREEYGQ
jgi:T-complex protein 1 subunit beta